MRNAMNARILTCVVVCVVTLGGCRSQHVSREPVAPKRTTPTTPAAPPAAWQEIGRSRQGNPLQAASIGGGPYRVYIIGGIHGNEPEGLAAAMRLVDLAPSEVRGVALRVLRDANPDGTAANTRGNSRGLDLNRNWPASNFNRSPSRGATPLSEPETQAVHRDIDAFRPHLLIVFHSIANGPFVNFDGPAGEHAEVFVAAARVKDSRWKVVPRMGYPTPGSLGSYYGVDRRIPILTIEFRRGQDEASAVAAVMVGLRALIDRGLREAVGFRSAELQQEEKNVPGFQ